MSGAARTFVMLREGFGTGVKKKRKWTCPSRACGYVPTSSQVELSLVESCYGRETRSRRHGLRSAVTHVCKYVKHALLFPVCIKKSLLRSDSERDTISREQHLYIS